MSSRLPARHLPAIVLAALAAGGVAIALALGSDHQEAKVAWAIFGPVVGWSFVGVGVYTWRYRDETRIGALMVLLAGGWFLFTLGAADSRLLYTASLIVGGLWGGVFLHSRARIVSAGDAERRRLERDLHDGAQSRLVALSLLLRAALTRAEPESELASMLERAQEELQTSLSELRELARGIHPAVLTDRGLEPALQALASRAPVPVTVEAGPEDEDRLPGQVETAAYFVVSEALTNVAKYAHASHATVAVRRDNDHVTVEVIDDGIGGADATRGTGLRGLADRLSALDGTLSLDSAPGRGTRLHAEIPVGPED